MNGRGAFFGLLLLTAWPLTAQTGSVRIQVTDPKGALVTRANVSLADSWNRVIRTLSTNDAGEILWTNVPLGRSYFSVNVPGFNILRIALTVCDSREQHIQAKLPLPPNTQVITVDSASALVETIEMPNCGTLDAPKSVPLKRLKNTN